MNDETFAELASRVAPIDINAATAARELQDRLTKPQGSLGFLETLSVQLAGIAGVCPPPVPEPATIAIFAGDHGVVEAGVTAWPSEVTAQMVANFCSGGAAINVLARHVGARVIIVDVGVATPIPGRARSREGA
jgi:nicotinate-nucleotide--dimethylbenzimidazole phosphoribosyltransferase